MDRSRSLLQTVGATAVHISELCIDLGVVGNHPGHTLGSICIAGNDVVFTGDTLFKMSVGRSDFPGGDHDVLISSITNELMKLPKDTLVYPGHGPETSIGVEKDMNPFLRI